MLQALLLNCLQKYVPVVDVFLLVVEPLVRGCDEIPFEECDATKCDRMLSKESSLLISFEAFFTRAESARREGRSIHGSETTVKTCSILEGGEIVEGVTNGVTAGTSTTAKAAYNRFSLASSSRFCNSARACCTCRWRSVTDMEASSDKT